MLNSQIEIPDRVGRICEGLIPYFKELIVRTGENNSNTIIDFLIAIKIENNISECTKSNYIVTISFLSSIHKNKMFKEMSREDILLFLDSFRKPEVSDPSHRWIYQFLYPFPCLDNTQSPGLSISVRKDCELSL